MRSLLPPLLPSLLAIPLLLLRTLSWRGCACDCDGWSCCCCRCDRLGASCLNSSTCLTHSSGSKRPENPRLNSHNQLARHCRGSKHVETSHRFLGCHSFCLTAPASCVKRPDIRKLQKKGGAHQKMGSLILTQTPHMLHMMGPQLWSPGLSFLGQAPIASTGVTGPFNKILNPTPLKHS